MPRARYSANGIDIAKPGYDVDTAGLANMTFSSSLVAARIIKTGIVTPAPFSGYMNSLYYQSIVYLDAPLPRPPIVLVAGINADGTSDQTPFVISQAFSSDGIAYRRPFYEIRTFTDRFELCTAIGDADIRPMPPTWRYWVFANTLDV